jgi:pyruvate/2-oxoacid:ferredoxin oxidoreductase alpha subunit
MLMITSDDVRGTAGSGSRLAPGIRLSRDDLLRLALMSSENRAAYALCRSYPDGEPATADSDEFIRQYVENRDDRRKVAEKYAFYEYGWNKEADTLVIAFGITRRIAQPLAPYFALFRPIRIWPTLDKELAEIAPKYKKIIVIEGSDGQSANVIERLLLRRVDRVPLLGGRMSLEAVREGLDLIGELPKELAAAGATAHVG